MKKILLFLFFILMSVGYVFSAEEIYKTAKFGSLYNSASIGNYTSTWYSTYNGFRVDITNANNNQNGWDYIKFGRKNNTSIGTISTNTVIDKKITKVVLTIDALTVSKINSVTLYTSTNNSTWNSRGTFTKAVGEQEVEIYANNQAVNLYYKITFDCASGSSNGLITISQVDFYTEVEDTPCDSVTISLTTPINGTASLSKNKVCPGDEIEVSYTPNDGYMLDKILANDVEVTSPVEITENTTIQVLFKEIPPAPSIDVAVWDTNAVYINIDNFEGITAEIEGKTGNNVADDLFFSKYFEAAGSVKLLSIYNGTPNDVDLSEYAISIDMGSGFSSKKFKDMKYCEDKEWDNLISFTPEQMNLKSKTEIILISFANKSTTDEAIIKCAKEHSESKYDSYYRLRTPTLDFNGDDPVALINPDGGVIDLIGAGTISDGKNISDTTKATGSDGNVKGFMDNPGGWYTENGYKADASETYPYAIATNRCLLIRRNHVKSGYAAVERNTTTFLTLGDYEYNGINYQGEWKGIQIPGKSSDAGSANSCEGFKEVGKYDYSGYYSSSVDLIEALQEDGTYKLEISQLDTLACNNIKIIAKDNSNNTVDSTFKVPIMVSENKTSTQVLTKHGASCPTCDLVVMHDAVLTVDNALSNRDVKVYAGSRLSINSDKTYTVNSLSLRKTDDTNPYLTLNGNISLAGDSSFYLDVYTDPSEWRWLALPDTFDLRKLRLSNGKPVIYGEDYLIKTYNGYIRALTQNNGWVTVSPDKQFMPGEGFIFGLAGSGNIKKEYRFKFSNNILIKEKQNKKLQWEELQSWGCDQGENLRPNHKGWNLIGNAFLDVLNTEVYTPIGVGNMVHSDTDPWDGKWEIEEGSTGPLRYRVKYERGTDGEDGNGYTSELLDNVKLEPFSTFFVQLGGNTQSPQEITLSTSQKRNAMRRMIMTDSEADDELFLRVFVGDKKTGMFISNKFTEDYEPGDDLESRQTIYQSIGGYKLLYSAIPDSTIEKGVLINSQSGKLFLDEKVNVNNFEYIYVKYGDSWYNLHQGETVEIESGTFILQAKRKNNDIPTGLDAIPTKGIYKFTDGKYIYINRNGELINVLGNKIK